MKLNSNRRKKTEIVKLLVDEFKQAKSMVLVEYLGLSVVDITNLRNELEANGVTFKVYKNRLVKLAAKTAGFADLTTSLIGPNAIAFAQGDEIAPARIIAKHAKDHGVLKFKSGVFENRVIDVAMLKTLSQIPSREVLLTQIAVGLLQPLQQLAIGLNMLEVKKSKAEEKIIIEKKTIDEIPINLGVSKDKIIQT